jgi:hypothetical protein
MSVREARQRQLLFRDTQTMITKYFLLPSERRGEDTAVGQFVIDPGLVVIKA